MTLGVGNYGSELWPAFPTCLTLGTYIALQEVTLWLLAAQEGRGSPSIDNVGGDDVAPLISNEVSKCEMLNCLVI